MNIRAMPSYRSRIAAEAPDFDPRHIEAFMRLEHGCLDGLSPQQFNEEVGLARECILADESLAERLAQSYGL